MLNCYSCLDASVYKCLHNADLAVSCGTGFMDPASCVCVCVCVCVSQLMGFLLKYLYISITRADSPFKRKNNIRLHVITHA